MDNSINTIESARADYEKWEDDTTKEYVREITADKTIPPELMGLSSPLYRATKVSPDRVFTKNGVLPPTNKNWQTGSFSLSNHQDSSAGSVYTSFTRDLEGAINRNRDGYVYIADPQFHGRDQNANNANNDDMTGLESRLPENEVSVPGPIPTEDVRGALKVTARTVAYDALIKNPHYVSQPSRRSEEATYEATPADIEDAKKAVTLHEARIRRRE